MAKRKTTTEEQPTPIDPETAPVPLQEAQAETVRESRDVPVEELPTTVLPAIAKDVKESEPEPVKEARREVEAVLNKPIEAIEDTVNKLDEENKPKSTGQELPHASSNVTIIRGRVIPYPLYTVVFGVLGVITLVEVAITQIFPKGILLTLILVVLSISKAVLVMLFYMHLKDDSRIFAAAIILPILIAIVATLFLTAVPPTGY